METPPGWNRVGYRTPTPTESPVFPSLPLASASQSSESDSLPERHHTQASSSVHQLRRPQDIRTGTDAPNAGDDRRNRAFSVRFVGNVGDGDGNMRMPSPVGRVEESGFTDIPMGMTTPFIGGRELAMAMPSPSLGVVGLGFTSPVLKFNGYGEHGPFLCHSPHPVVYQDDVYPTALHLFEAHKFLPHRPDLADRIRLCERAGDVAGIGAELAVFTRRDWGHVVLSIVGLFPSLFFLSPTHRCGKGSFSS